MFASRLALLGGLVPCALFLQLLLPDPKLTAHPVEIVSAVAEAGPSVEDAVDALLAQLQRGHILDRQEAADALGRLGPAAEKAVPALTRLLGHPSLDRPAAFALAAIGPRGLPPLLAALRSGRGHSDSAREVLARTHLGPTLKFWDEVKGKGDFLWRLQHEREEARWAMVGGEKPVPQASVVMLPYLIRKAKSDDWQDRVIALKGLATLGPLARPAIPTLLNALEDEWPLQETVIRPGWGFYGVGSGPTRRYDSVRVSAVQALLAIGPAAEGPLLKVGLPRLIAGVSRGTDVTRAHTARAIGLLGRRAGPAITDLVEQVRTFHEPLDCLQALGAIGPEAGPAVVGLLASEESCTRTAALEILASFGKEASRWSPDVARLASDRQPEVRRKALGTLIRIDPEGKTVVPVSLERLRDNDSTVRVTAASLLEEYGPRAPAAVPGLEKALEDEDPCVAYAAIRALIRIGASQKAAVRKLAELFFAFPGLEGLPEILADSGPDAREVVPTLLRMLDGEGGHVWCATRALLHIRAPEAKQAIPGLLRVGDIKLMGALGPEARSVVPHLSPLILHPAHTDVVLWALKRIGPDVALVREVVWPKVAAGMDPGEVGRALALLDPEGEKTIPALRVMLRCSGERSRAFAARHLGKQGVRARAAVPQLERALQEDGSAEVRLRVAKALLQITGEQEPYAEIVELEQAHIERDRRRDEEAKAHRPSRRDDSREMHELLADLRNRRIEIQEEAVRALIEFGPAARDAVPCLVRLLETKVQVPQMSDSDIIPLLLEVLQAIGPDANAAIPVLRELRKSAEDDVLEAIDRTLRKIEGRSSGR
jgi:HEAT repeat protein